MSGRRVSLASLPGKPFNPVADTDRPAPAPEPEPITADSATAAGLTVVQQIPLAAIAPTPLNSRRDFGTAEELRTFGESLIRRQIQAVVVVPRPAYLALWPEHADATDGRDYVLVAGERRWRGLGAVGAGTINAVVQADLAGSRLGFLDAVFTENFDRKNLDPIEEAHAIEELVRVLGTARAVAEHYKKTEGWASQRRRLLQLTPDLQHLVSSGEIRIEAARQLSKLPAGDQAPAWQRMKDEAAQPKAPRPAETASSAADFTAVKSGAATGTPDGGRPPAPEAGADFTAVKSGSPQPVPAVASSEDPGDTFTAVKPSADTVVAAMEAAAEDRNFTAVKSDSHGQLPEQRDSAPVEAQPDTVILHLSRDDFAGSALAIRSALDVRPAVRLAAELITLLQREPEFPQIMAEIRASQVRR